MSIWFNKELSTDHLNKIGKKTMGEYLGIEWSEVGSDYLEATMPVDERTRQPYGLLHGGASCALAETLGSVGSAMVVDHDKFFCVGLEINANHIKGVKGGRVTGRATPLHLGRSTHVWEIRIRDENEQLICISRLTVVVMERKIN